jgi:hypothetical protein
MSNINSLAGGYKKSTPNIRTEKKYKSTIPKQVNVEEIYNKIKMLHADGNLSTSDVNTIISELQKIV